MKTRVIIVGGGFGGLAVAKRLSNAPHLEVVLLDATNHHLFQPLLYQVACAALHPADIAEPLREILKNAANTTVLMEKAVKVDREKRTIEFSNGKNLEYDHLVLAVGARHSYFGHDEWERFAPGLKNLGDALEIRRRILTAYERREAADFFARDNVIDRVNFVIIGGGPTGVELAGAISDIARQVLSKNFRLVHPEKTQIYLVEGGPRLLGMFPPELSVRATQNLEQLGVAVMTHSRVTQIDNSGVHIGQTFIPTAAVFWAAGNVANPLLGTLGSPQDDQGRVFVEPDLSLPDHPEIFVIGDAAHTKGSTGQPLPALAAVAVQQGRHVGHLILKGISSGGRAPFRYRDRGSLATIGRRRAVGILGGWKITGLFAWLIWNGVHITHIIGFGNKLFVMMNWMYNYFSGSRFSRLIYKNFKK